jgi:hypothetical protein
MFRFQNRNNRKNAISKGSEYRTAILLANLSVCSERPTQRQFFFAPMNKILKELDKFSVLLRKGHLSALETFNTH